MDVISLLVKRGLDTILKSGARRNERAVSVLTPNHSSFAAALLGVWSCDGTVAAVPLCKAHPETTLEYYVKDSRKGLQAVDGITDLI